MWTNVFTEFQASSSALSAISSESWKSFLHHQAGVLGESSTFNGVLGYTTAAGHAGVAGACDEGDGNGVYGRSKNVDGVVGYSSATGHSGVAGVNEQGDGNGVYGRSTKQAGVYGESKGFNGVLGQTTADGHAGVAGVSDEGNGNGVYGRSKNRNGVYGVSAAAEHSGVVGQNDSGTGVLGRSTNSRGVWGLSDNSVGVLAQTRSSNTPALQAFQSNPSSNSFALYAKHDGGKTAGFFEGGVWGTSETNEGVHAETKSTFFAAIAGISLNPNRDPGGGGSAGIFGKSEAGEGVHGETNSNFFAAVAGIQLNPNSTGAGVYGEHRGNGPAGFFKGSVAVTASLTVQGVNLVQRIQQLEGQLNQANQAISAAQQRANQAEKQLTQFRGTWSRL